MLAIETLYIPYNGAALLENPLLNKGLAFIESKYTALNLQGLLPHNAETIEEQTERAWGQFCQFKKSILRHIYLRNIQDTNEALFYNLPRSHMKETLPVIYTPMVGEACGHFLEIYCRGRGLFISWPSRHQIDEMLQGFFRNDIKVIVVTDSERILGLGDQRVGGMEIPIGGLSLYTAYRGVHPAPTLPIMLDVGINNPQHLEDPLYMDWRYPRISNEQYLKFMDMLVHATQQRWSDVPLQFGGFVQKNVARPLNCYCHQLCCFNDDIQGTAVAASGTLIAAAATAGTPIRGQRVVLLGGGSAGCGIAEKITALMVDGGLSQEEARHRIFMADRFGLLTDEMPSLLDFQCDLATPRVSIVHWDTESTQLSLTDVVRNIHPIVLIGVSGQPRLSSEEIVKETHRYYPRPIITPPSNPTSRVEAQPKDLLERTWGSVPTATGSPFEPVPYDGKTYDIAQCNNAYIFPGLGLEILASRVQRVTEAMLITCSKTLAAHLPLASRGTGALLPLVEETEMISRAIAAEVVRAVQRGGATPRIDEAQLATNIDKTFWRACYTAYKRLSF